MPEQDLKALHDFIKSSRNQSSSFIIKEFLATIIKRKHISEYGSVLIDRPILERLVLFNEKDFLHNEGYLEQGHPWTKEFGYFEGIAGRAFRTREIQVANNAKENPEFSIGEGEVPIANLVCAPILFNSSDTNKPFGVVSFHNASIEKEFTDHDIDIIRAYTDALGLMLELADNKFEWKKGE
ncbi:MAG: GAF domain-containing protein [Bacteroidales bacterium]|nr:GAF domain-containing protein [Bacteroidales bacterium]